MTKVMSTCPGLNLVTPRLFEEKRGYIVFGIASFGNSVLPSDPLQVVGTLCMQLLLQFYSDSFENLQVFRTWSEDVHIVWISSLDFFLLLFYAPTFGNVEGAYCFRLVRASVCLFKIYLNTVLKFHIWIPHKKLCPELLKS